ncbi:MAG: hypothetical protein IPQ21_22390 [Betaproteobacteria bacterium]|nr:hypothetical protein [Betaproteobacteria bacterium]
MLERRREVVATLHPQRIREVVVSFRESLIQGQRGLELLLRLPEVSRQQQRHSVVVQANGIGT